MFSQRFPIGQCRESLLRDKEEVVVSPAEAVECHGRFGVAGLTIHIVHNGDATGLNVLVNIPSEFLVDKGLPSARHRIDIKLIVVVGVIIVNLKRVVGFEIIYPHTVQAQRNITHVQL